MEKVESGKAVDKPPDFDSLWDNDHPDVSEKKLRELLPGALDSRDLSYFSQLLTQIARAEGLLRKFDDAHKTLDRVEKALPITDVKTKIRYLLERGRVLSSAGKTDEARPLLHEAVDLAVEKKEDLYAVDASRTMALAESPENRMQWNLKALAIAEASEDEKARKFKGALYYSIGWGFSDQKQYEEALYMFEKALESREKEGNAAGVRMAKWWVAKTLRMMDHNEEALEMQSALYDEYEAMGRRNGHVYEEIAECLLAMGQGQEAQPWFAAACEELSKQPNVGGDASRLDRLRELGKVGRPSMENYSG